MIRAAFPMAFPKFPCDKFPGACLLAVTVSCVEGRGKKGGWEGIRIFLGGAGQPGNSRAWTAISAEDRHLTNFSNQSNVFIQC